MRDAQKRRSKIAEETCKRNGKKEVKDEEKKKGRDRQKGSARFSTN